MEGKQKTPPKNSKVPNKKTKGIEHQSDLATKSINNEGNTAMMEEKTLNKSIRILI